MDTVFFIVSKLAGAALRPESWFLALLALALLAVLRGWSGLAAGSLGLALTGLAVLAVYPVGKLLLRPLEAPFPIDPAPAGVALILVLGGGEDRVATAATGLTALNEAGERLVAGLLLARRHPEARLGFTGGVGRLGGGAAREADVAARLWTEAGVAPARLRLESAARTTWENAVNARATV